MPIIYVLIYLSVSYLRKKHIILMQIELKKKTTGLFLIPLSFIIYEGERDKSDKSSENTKSKIYTVWIFIIM